MIQQEQRRKKCYWILALHEHFQPAFEGNRKYGVCGLLIRNDGHGHRCKPATYLWIYLPRDHHDDYGDTVVVNLFYDLLQC